MLPGKGLGPLPAQLLPRVLAPATLKVVDINHPSLFRPDLAEMLRREMVCIFTCANDYSDLKGELLVFQLLGAQLVLKPQRSPFKAATIVRAPGSEKSANGGVEWSCSSCFLYAVRGRTEGAPPLVEGPALLSALKKLAKHHKKTQTPSEVP